LGPEDLTTFRLKRWQFLVPTFETDEFEYKFDSDRLLPFQAKVPTGELPSGTFSDVSQVKMLASKQNKLKVRGETINVALKTLRKLEDPRYDIRKEFYREAKAHRQLNGKREHIIQAFAAYQQIASHPDNNTYHLVLEWADGGSLHDFWSKNPECQLNHLDGVKSRKRVMELLEQLLGLADALEGMHATSSHTPGNSRRGSAQTSPGLSPVRTLHKSGDSLDVAVQFDDDSHLPTFTVDMEETSPDSEQVPKLSVLPPDAAGLDAADPPNLSRRSTNFNSENWRHGDIKPENILRFTGGNSNVYLGVLKLADLGRAQQHILATEMRDTKEKELWRTRWYEPPDLEGPNYMMAKEKISRLFDIWSMGCVIFEAVLWVLYGNDSIDFFLKANNLTGGQQGATPYWKKGARGEYEVSSAVTS